MKSFLALLVLSLIATLGLMGCDAANNETDSSATAPPSRDTAPPAPTPPPAPATPAAPAPQAPGTPASQPASTRVVIETNMGQMVVELDDARVPGTVKNFLQYVDDSFYDNTIFHRVVANFVIQGGGFDTSLREKDTRPPITNEGRQGRKNTRGSIAMARTPDPNSATSQFYINLKHNAMLDGAYCAFGEVIEGMDVADKIGAMRTENRGGAFGEIPAEEVVIKSIRRK